MTTRPPASNQHDSLPSPPRARKSICVDKVPVLHEASFQRLLRSRTFCSDPRWPGLPEPVRRAVIERWACNAELWLLRHPRTTCYCYWCGRRAAYIGMNEAGSGGPVDCDCKYHDPARLPRERAGNLVAIPRPAGPRGELPDAVAITDPPTERGVARIAFLEARLAVLARLLASQAPAYRDTLLAYWNHRPLTHDPFVRLLR